MNLPAISRYTRLSLPPSVCPQSNMRETLHRASEVNDRPPYSVQVTDLRLPQLVRLTSPLPLSPRLTLSLLALAKLLSLLPRKPRGCEATFYRLVPRC
jgi:hypothetical protein